MTNHAIKRAFERYGLVLDYGRLAEICAKIKNGEALLAGRFEDGRERWVVEFAGVTLKAIYRPKHDVIVTFEAPGRWRPRSQRQGWRRHRKRRNRLRS